LPGPLGAPLRRGLLPLLLALIPLTAACEKPPPPPAKPVHAIYYLWWSADHWRGHLGPSYPYAVRPAPLPGELGADGCGIRSRYGSRLLDVSEGLTYDQDRAGVIERDLRQAHRVGLSGFLVNWKGSGRAAQTPDSTSYSRRLEEVFRAANELRREGKRFTLILDYRTASRQPVSYIANDLAYFLDRYGRNPALDHSYSAKPEIVIRFSRGYSVAELRELRSRFGGRAYIIGDESYSSWSNERAAVLDGNSYYWSSQDPYGNPRSFSHLQGLAKRIRASGDTWLAPVHPGYDNKLLDGGSCVPRRNGETLRRLYAGNRRSQPDGWALISWNEIAENTHVLPLRRYGASYLLKLGATLR
jgi:hypothetical protein